MQSVPDDEWATLLGRPIPADTVKIDRNMTLGELNTAAARCAGWSGLCSMMLNASCQARQAEPERDVPVQHAAARAGQDDKRCHQHGHGGRHRAGGKGFWVIGLLKVIVEAVKNIILNAQLESRLRNS